MSRAIFIIGPQGSGSSCLAGALHSAGIIMGSNLRGKSPLNPKGHFEDLTFEYLAEKKDFAQREEEFKNYFEKRNESVIWGLKSFQIVFCYQFVLPYVQDCRVLSIDRPEEGAIRSSIAKYGHFKSRESIEAMHAEIRKQRTFLIEEYNLKNMEVNFNDLTDNPKKVLERVFEFCCEDISFTLDLQSAISFVDPLLNHKREIY